MTLAGLVSLGSAALAVIYATEARSKGNESELIQHDERIKANTSDVVYIKGRIGSMETSMKRTADGIEDFKKQQVLQLEKDKETLERKVERLERTRNWRRER